MATSFTPNSKHRIEPQADADERNRGARSEETVYRRLSRLDWSISPDPARTRNLPGPQDSTEKDSKARTRTWFVVMDKSGPLADFETWADAYRFITTNDVAGCIIRIDEPREPTDSDR